MKNRKIIGRPQNLKEPDELFKTCKKCGRTFRCKPTNKLSLCSTTRLCKCGNCVYEEIGNRALPCDLDWSLP